jgi:hypothetical protein
MFLFTYDLFNKAISRSDFGNSYCDFPVIRGRCILRRSNH